MNRRLPDDEAARKEKAPPELTRRAATRGHALRNASKTAPGTRPETAIKRLSTRIALAEKFVVFAKGNIALAEKFVTLCEDFLQIRKR